VAGGVAANGCLRKRFEQRALGFDRRGRKKLPPFELFFPTFKFCTDNGAMAAGLGCRLFERGEFAPLDVEADPTPLRPNL